MGHSNGKITAPIATDDVSEVLGVNNHDVATLCRSTQINKWAKYKPEAIGTYEDIALAQRKSNNFGLVAQSAYTSVDNFITAVKNGTFNGGWDYTQVADGDWGRLTDFDGYNHNALSPFGSLNAQNIELRSGVDVVIAAVAPPPVSASDDGQINISDLTGNVDGTTYANYYFGVILWNSSRTMIATSSNTIGSSQDWQVDFGSIGTSYAGTYNAVPFLSSKVITFASTYPSSPRITGTGGDEVIIKLLSSADMYSFVVRCFYTSSTSTTISYSVSITNPTNTAVSFSNVLLRVAKSSTGSTPTTAVSFGNVTVAANDKWQKTGKVYLSSRTFTHAMLSTSRGNSAWVTFMASPITT